MLDFKKNGVVPLYMQIADWIRENIYAGIWKAGESIPSEYQLMDILRISRGTIKKAVETLATQGLILKIQGKGTFVADSNVSYSLGTNGHGFLSISESLDRMGIDYETKVVKACFEKANEDIAKKLQIKKGDAVFYLERIRLINGNKAIFMENWINPVLCPNADRNDFNRKTLFSVVEGSSQHKIKFIKGHYVARSIGCKRGALLGIDRETPVLYGEQLAHLDNDVPVDLGIIWLRSDQYCFNLTLYR
ncbi:GntR family transcriptional regulator [Pectinatus haikarae]|uniref:DNA-binding GntR family transcriptional regulator n=1 Tax=Pectinatus haikarae TaxID=349096 RepID=A0ABT9Y9V2_9FIRM|nr:GntR family transcriptional regulator [Pectinatus haikarae]MDQ0204608.1 DNA-binding GntR family transcriptional regulator [Pectinatus haikarae]